MTIVLVIGAVLLSVQGLLAVASLLRSGSLGGRMIALDTTLVAIINAIALHALWADTSVFIDVMVVTALLGFIGTLTVARFVEDRR